MRNKPICHDRKIIAKSRLFEIEQMDLEFSNGVRRVYECIRGPNFGAVLIVGITSKQELVLVREYCAGTDRYELGFPKGLIDANETALEAANRELKEEVGMGANQLSCLKSVTLAPGYFGARLDIILATNLYPEKLKGDEPEELEIIYWPLSEYEALLNMEDFTESRSIAALLLVSQLYTKE
jgi:ADP compounds hydrolase